MFEVCHEFSRRNGKETQDHYKTIHSTRLKNNRLMLKRRKVETREAKVSPLGSQKKETLCIMSALERAPSLAQRVHPTSVPKQKQEDLCQRTV